jgi:hypothetical protein
VRSDATTVAASKRRDVPSERPTRLTKLSSSSPIRLTTSSR